MPHKKLKRKIIHKHKKKQYKHTHPKKSVKPTNTNMASILPACVKTTGKKRKLPIEIMPTNDSVPSQFKYKELVKTHIVENNVLNLTSQPTNNTSTNNTSLTQLKKIREQVWIHHNKKKFETKCFVTWCTNIVSVFNFQVGHDMPKALGGSNKLSNLKPICHNCNQSMGSRYSISEWNQLFSIRQLCQMATISFANNTGLGNGIKLPHNINKLSDKYIPLETTTHAVCQQHIISTMKPYTSHGLFNKINNYTYPFLNTYGLQLLKNKHLQGFSTLGAGLIILTGTWLCSMA